MKIIDIKFVGDSLTQGLQPSGVKWLDATHQGLYGIGLRDVADAKPCSMMFMLIATSSASVNDLLAHHISIMVANQFQVGSQTHYFRPDRKDYPLVEFHAYNGESSSSVGVRLINLNKSIYVNVTPKVQLLRSNVEQVIQLVCAHTPELFFDLHKMLPIVQ